MQIKRIKYYCLLILVLLVSCAKEDYIGSEQSENLVKYFGGSASDKALDMKLCDDGGYALTGSLVYNNISQAFFIKTDKYGNALASSPQLLSNGNVSSGNSICQTKDGGFLISGFTQNSVQAKNILIAKVTSEGLMAWTRSLGGTNNEEGLSVAETADGNILVAGYTESKSVGGKDAWCLLLDNDGNRIWDRSYGFAGDDVCISFLEEPDYFLLIGYTLNTGIFMAKVEKTSGVPSEFGYYGSTGNVTASAVIRDGLGNSYILANKGVAETSRIYVMKLNYRSSQEVWDKTIDSENSEAGYGLALRSDKLVVAGSSNGDFLVDIFDTSGQLLNVNSNRIQAQGSQVAYACALGSDGKIVLAGSNEVLGFSKITLVKKVIP